MNDPDTSILAVHPGALGDVILFGHFLAALRSLSNEARSVRLVAGGAKARLLAEARVVDEAIDFDALPMQELFTDGPLDGSRLGTMLGRCEQIVTCFLDEDTPPAKRLAALCGASDLTALPTRPPADFAGHLSELWRQQLRLSGQVEPADWNIPQSWRTDAEAALRKLGLVPGRAYAVLHPGAGAPEKCWPIDHFAALADELRRSEMDAVFPLGPVELERWADENIARLARVGTLLAGASLTLLAGVLAGASLFVGNDSGPAHLAAAVGTPTVAMFAPTSPVNFAPLGRRVACVKCDAMEDLSTREVLEAIDALGVL